MLWDRDGGGVGVLTYLLPLSCSTPGGRKDVQPRPIFGTSKLSLLLLYLPGPRCWGPSRVPPRTHGEAGGGGGSGAVDRARTLSNRRRWAGGFVVGLDQIGGRGGSDWIIPVRHTPPRCIFAPERRWDVVRPLLFRPRQVVPPSAGTGSSPRCGQCCHSRPSALGRSFPTVRSSRDGNVSLPVEISDVTFYILILFWIVNDSEKLTVYDDEEKKEVE